MDFLDRLKKEHADLLEKYQKLDAFIDTDAFQKLDSRDRELLVEQQDAMLHYGSILEERISRLESE